MSTQTLAPQETNSPKSHKRGWLVAGAIVVVIGLVVSFFLVRPETTVVREDSVQTVSASPAQLTDVAGSRIFLGHQSVGQNMIDAVPAIYSAAGVDEPTIIESSAAQTGSDAYFQHAYIGTNGDPLGKIAEFDRIMRSGVADQVQVAAMKLCYVDFDNRTDVDQVFNTYRDTLAGLQRDYPDVTFMYATVPVTTDRGLVQRVKARVGLKDTNPPARNVVREEFNEKVRAQYSSTGRLFDIAATQATSDGTRVLLSYDGAEYFAMDDTLASDYGHLNPDGAVIVGGAFLESIAQADATGTST